MGIAIIASGQYNIDAIEGEAIAKFVPPKINFESWKLSLAQREQLQIYDHQWQFLACWLVDLRTGRVDTKEYPFTTSDFQDLYPKAELLNALLELCREVWKGIEIRHYYPTAYDWWVACILEEQASAIEAIRKNKEPSSKRELLKQLGDFRRSLERKIIPFVESKSNKHLYRLYKSVFTLNPQLIRSKWNLYLEAMSKYTSYLKANEVKVLIQIGNNLCYQDGKKYIRL